MMAGRPRSLDINVDSGESYGIWRIGADEKIFPLVSSANVACGFHGGDPATIRRTVEVAVENDVAVGAHPGLPDLMGFGRRVMEIDAEDAYSYITYQVGALVGMLRPLGVPLNHVKVHGALETILEKDAECATAAAQAIRDAMDSPLVYWPAALRPDPLTDALRGLGIPVVRELYLDLDYAADGTITVERNKKARDPRQVEAAVERFIADGTIAAVDGTPLRLDASSICLHGDGPNAVELVTAVRSALDRAGVALSAPVIAGRSG